ncbi:S1C family serine protease [Clostridium tarantellae]|uniref:Trypsin-like serine protease n=1 Tax=Clostridium tarantellae TaxID=39493 RepID=A0A6I1MLB1_9CLOT|nr:trypsin-like peptidase domain-containing protein [Clostridium tarantellae]MPQ44195.1 trypsin-like serine protease [Clostridium tarantellae]
MDKFNKFNDNEDEKNKKESNEEYFGMDSDKKDKDEINEIKDFVYVTEDEVKNNFDKNEEVKDKSNSKKLKKNVSGKKRNLKKSAVFVASGLVCAMLGGVIGASSIYFLPKNNKVETVSSKNVYDNMPHQFAKEEGALTVPQAVEKVKPAVVGVSTKSLVQDSFFTMKEQEGIGSGFIINDDGYIVTNYHVINGAQEVKVIFYDGTEVNAKVVNYDPKEDIAVIKITDDVKMPGVAELGDSNKLKPGEDVIAIGNPLGKEFSSTVTKGVVSSPNRQISTDGVNVTQYIQTDAAINPGNSGGPLINSQGQVIGINTAKKVGEEIEGIGFSIPIDKVRDRLDALSKPILKLGITARDINAETAKLNNLQEGIYVVNVQEFSPAEKAGLKGGDLIVEFNGQRVKTTEEMNKLKEKCNNGDVITLKAIRDGKPINIKVTLAS